MHQSLMLGLLTSFEPTYKELKLGWCCGSHLHHRSVLSLPIRNWNLLLVHLLVALQTRFEPTYKELKQSSITCSKFSIVGFEPTYKELKPFGAGEKNMENLAFWAYL